MNRKPFDSSLPPHLRRAPCGCSPTTSCAIAGVFVPRQTPPPAATIADTDRARRNRDAFRTRPPEEMPVEKYMPFRPLPLRLPDREWPNHQIEHAPIWCSVDLRDGNQALIDPMDPAASCRCSRPSSAWASGDRGRVPVGVAAGLRLHPPVGRRGSDPRRRHDPGPHAVPSRVDRANLRVPAGRRRAIVHFYNSTSVLQRRVVFRSTRRRDEDRR